MDYAAIQKRVTYHKRALTVAKKKGARAVIDAVDRFYREFDNNNWPYPDNWHNWDIARRDAQFAIQREGAL